MRVFNLIVVVSLFLPALHGCTKCSSTSTPNANEQGACLYHLETCKAENGKKTIDTTNHSCQNLSEEKCLKLKTIQEETEFCTAATNDIGKKRHLSVSFFSAGSCPKTSDQAKTSDNTEGACFYDEEVCRVNDAGTKIETDYHKCEYLSESECQAIQEECDALADECIVLGDEEEEIPRFCFASFAKDGDTRPLNVLFIASAKCPKPSANEN